jgi:hypothetical protein
MTTNEESGQRIDLRYELTKIKKSKLIIKNFKLKCQNLL